GDEGSAVEVVGRPLLEIEDAEQADSQHHARRHAENHVDEPQPPGGSEVELAPDQDEFDPQGGDQGECCKVVEKSEEGSHLSGLIIPVLRSARLPQSSSPPKSCHHLPRTTARTGKNLK